MTYSVLGILQKMDPHLASKPSAEQTTSNRGQTKQEVNDKDSSVARSAPSLNSQSKEPPQSHKTMRKRKSGRDEGDQGSTQSSAGDSSDNLGLFNSSKSGFDSMDEARNSNQDVIRASSRLDPGGKGTELQTKSILTSKVSTRMNKDEENIASSSELPDRGLFPKEVPRKSVRIMEPSAGSSGRLSSGRSLDIDDNGDDFLVESTDPNNMSRRNRFGRPESNRSGTSEGSTGRSFLSTLTDDPKDQDWKNIPEKSLLWKLRIICGKIVENPTVQLTIIALIIINAIFMGVGTFDFVTDNNQVNKAFDSLDKAFLIVFTIELALQLIYRSFSYFTDSWLVFDFVIVVISWSLESLQIVRAFRIFRAFRLVTRIGPLRELVMAIGEVMPRMYAIALLLLLIFYIFAVLFTELFRDITTETNYFGSLDVSLFTCMQLMTLEWSGIARETMSEKSWAWAPILAFMSVTGFIVFNLIVAVVCDAVAIVDREVQAERLGEIETDTTKLEKAQERIWDMTEHVEQMLHAQRELQDVLAQLNIELEDLTGKSTGITRRTSSPSLIRMSQKNLFGSTKRLDAHLDN